MLKRWVPLRRREKLLAVTGLLTDIRVPWRSIHRMMVRWWRRRCRGRSKHRTRVGWSRLVSVVVIHFCVFLVFKILQRWIENLGDEQVLKGMMSVWIYGFVYPFRGLSKKKHMGLVQTWTKFKAQSFVFNYSIHVGKNSYVTYFEDRNPNSCYRQNLSMDESAIEVNLLLLIDSLLNL